jgi:tetratricopeptide (TPR) repeat protein/predicted O-methyltransferase YrrM
MASVFPRLLQAYRRHGFLIRTGLNPFYFNDPDAGFTHFLKDRRTPMNVGGGLAPVEIHFLECLFEGRYRPKNALVIGNAFGWSALALGLLVPRALVVAIDAGLEGNATAVGAELTRKIAAEEGVAVRVVDALSPRDLSWVVETEFGGAALDFVLVDGLHTNEQLVRDFDGAVPHASDACVFLLHDVLHWHMVAAFNGLLIGPTRERRLLTRCPSGMGIVFPSGIDRAARDAIDAYCDDTVDIAEFHASVGASERTPGPNLASRLSRGWRGRRLGMAATYEIEGKQDLAETELAHTALEGHADADAQFQLAAYHIDRGRWSEAERFLNNARRLAPGWELPPHQLGRVMRELGRYDAARALLEEASKLKPEWAAPHLEAGIVVRLLEGDAAAIPYFERATALAPAWAAPHFELGLVRFHLGEDGGAAACLDRAIAFAPEWAAPHHIMGLVQRRREGHRAAVGWLERAVALDPGCAASQYDLGLAQVGLDDTSAAVASFERAISLSPTWALAWREAGRSSYALSHWADASVRLMRAAELGQVDQTLWYQIGVCRRMTGEWSRALDAFLQARRSTPAWRALDKEIGICFRALGRLAESEAILSEAVAAEPEWAGAHLELGRTYGALQDWERAESEFQIAVRLRPAWSEARDALAQARRSVPA